MISVKKKVDISKYSQLLAFLNRKSEGHKPKKSSIFSKENIHRFLKEANVDKFLMMKVRLYINMVTFPRQLE